jgi:hypothetical protein
MAIRSDGPGKFDTVIDAYVHSLSLDGSDEECGDVETTNHYCSVRLGREGTRDILAEAKREGEPLTLEEAKFLRSHYGAIVEETNQGFVHVAYFKTRRALEKRWAEIEAEVAAADDDLGGAP